jgi:hypothetical protein
LVAVALVEQLLQEQTEPTLSLDHSLLPSAVAVVVQVMVRELLIMVVQAAVELATLVTKQVVQAHLDKATQVVQVKTQQATQQAVAVELVQLVLMEY